MTDRGRISPDVTRGGVWFLGMSKAFTKEDSSDEPAVVRTAPKLAPGEKRYVTPEGFRRLTQQRDALAERIRTVRGNAGASTGSARAALEGQLKALDATLAVLTVCEPPADLDHVFFGARVELEDEDGQPSSYRLVGPDEVDVKAGAISVESPLARSLLGRAVGDTVSVERPRGTREYTVAAIRYGEESR